MTASGITIRENTPLRELTTFKIGGLARYFTEITCEDEVFEALAFARERKLDLFIIGGGSNILISDTGFPGLVVSNKIKGLDSLRKGDSIIMAAGAGHDWDAFTRFCTEHEWQGVECLSGIPGTVGAAPVQNIGAYGQSADDVVEEVRAVNIETGSPMVFSNLECGFGYRTSIFNTVASWQYVITGVTFRLAVTGCPDITHPDLKKHFSAAAAVTPSQIREAVLSIRNSKGLLVLDGYERLNSAGSFFKNPVVSSGVFENIKQIIHDTGACSDWYWPRNSEEIKISAACLIQTAGFTRGFRRGDVGISPRHTLAIVNHGDATAGEVIAFAREIQECVRDKFGIVLQPEVQRIGEMPALIEA